MVIVIVMEAIDNGRTDERTWSPLELSWTAQNKQKAEHQIGCTGKCPVCLFVFCLACNKASHGAADCNGLQQETAVVEKVKGDQKESEAANKDYEVFHGMLKKSGPKRYNLQNLGGYEYLNI